MARGGKRPNSGRKVGSVTTRTAQVTAAALSHGITPLEYMLKTMRDETQPHEERFKAAIGAAPYVHPRLAAVEHKGDANNPIAYTVVSGVPRIEEIAERLMADDLELNYH